MLGTAENFRREPNGLLLARLESGVAIRVLEREGNWTQVELEGWVWLRSLEDSEEPGMDLVVAADGGENLRDRPSGAILGVLEEGALLEELGREPGWARVSRVGWIWSESLVPLSGPTTDPEPPPPGSPGTIGPAARAPGGFRTLDAGGPILTAPDGDTLAVAAPSSDIEIVRREGGWARVRLEGWMWMPVATDAAESEAVATVDPSALEPQDLMADPDAHAGRVVSWSIQFISLERAEAVRTDFFEGEPFLLARFGGTDGPFVYVAVAPDRLSEVEGLVPLEAVTITARVRTGASELTGAPIVDLIEVDRSDDRR